MSSTRVIPDDGLQLRDFVPKERKVNNNSSKNNSDSFVRNSRNHADNMLCRNESIESTTMSKNGPSFHLRTYGCQMNVNDSDIVRSVLLDAGYCEVSDELDADILLTNTCAIREGAERKIWHRLRDLKSKYKHQNVMKHWNLQKQNRSTITTRDKKIVGVLGCMAERLKTKLLEDGLADMVVGPDAYRDLPNLVQSLLVMQPPSVDSNEDFETNENLLDDESHLLLMHHHQPNRKNNKQQQQQRYAVNVQLSKSETYADIFPVRSSSRNRLRSNQPDVSAFVSIQRGCSNRCSFCIVPFTRGGVERSRPFDSIIHEITKLYEEEGVREVTLLGQNVNSYHDRSDNALSLNPHSLHQLSNDGFRSRVKRPDGGYFFADLLEAVSAIHPATLRVRFTSPHPKDYPKELLTLMSERTNICNQLHMPAQSGSTTCLQRMKRGYTRDAYLQLIETVRDVIPDVALSSDFISGFCGETEEEHADTLSLLNIVRYEQAYMFAYSVREMTHAHRTMTDDVPEEIKQRRLREVIDTFHANVQQRNIEQELGKLRLVLVEGESSKTTKNKIQKEQNQQKNQQATAKAIGISNSSHEVIIENDYSQNCNKNHSDNNNDDTVFWTGRTDQNKRIMFPVSVIEHDESNSNDNGAVRCYSYNDIMSILRNQSTSSPSFITTEDIGNPNWWSRLSSLRENNNKSLINNHHLQEYQQRELVLPDLSRSGGTSLNVGDYAVVQVTEVKGPTLRGKLLWRSDMHKFHKESQNLFL